MKNHTKKSRIAAALFALIFMLAISMAGCATVQVPESSEPDTTLPSATPVASQTAAPVASQTAAPGSDATPSPEEEGIGYVSLDVNPSIQLAIKDGVVLGVKAFNDDGEQITGSYDVIGMSYTDAVSTLIGALSTEGYFVDDGSGDSLIITACGDVEDGVLDEIEAQAQQSLTDLGLDCPVYTADVSNELAQTAKENGLTPGRYLLISYMAETEGITLDEAIEKYGHWKMGALMHLVGDSAGIFDNLAPVIDGLTPEQQQILTQAQNAYRAAMQEAVQANTQAKRAAIDAFQAAKTAAQQAFKDNKDKTAWKQAKTTAQEQFSLAKQDAKQAFTDAKTQAREQFMAAVSGLGLDPALIAQLLEWDYDWNWDYDYSWGDAPSGDDDDPQAEEPNNSDNNAGNGDNQDNIGSQDNEDDESAEDTDEDSNAGNDHSKPDKTEKPGKENNGKNQN